MNEAIQQLIATKDFEQLKPAQQEMVLAHMTELEYMQQRRVLQSSTWFANRHTGYVS